MLPFFLTRIVAKPYYNVTFDREKAARYGYYGDECFARVLESALEVRFLTHKPLKEESLCVTYGNPKRFESNAKMI